MTTALPACEGVFMRALCPHPQLFEEEYKRSNRNRGTKILRCFPHCCPHHVDRSYCGSSLEVVLRFDPESDVSQDVSQDVAQANRGPDVPFDVANVFVFARFETVDNAKPSAGAYSLRYLRSVSQSELSPEASWIEGVRQTAADRQQHSQQLHGRQPPSRPPSSTTDSATFVLNGQAFAKWYYHWGSGANKVQRATKHALKAYVFYQQEAQTPGPVQRTSSQQVEETETTAQQEPARDETLELLCIVTSPPFTVVSYRRAPLDVSAAFPGSPDALGIDAATSLMPHYATDTGHPGDSRLHRLVQNQISRAFQEYNEQRQQDPHGPSDNSFTSYRALDGSNESQRVNDEQNQFDRYRQLQEREGLRFRLLTPEDAALSGSSPREPRLVFDRTRQRDDHQVGDQQHWRDIDRTKEEDFVEDYEEDEEAVPQPLTTQSWLAQSASPYEVKPAGPIEMPPSATDPTRQTERTAKVTLLRLKQQQQQCDIHLREVQQLTDLSIIHFFVSRITTNSARGLANLEVVFTIAISQQWRFASGGATHLARLLLTIAEGKRGGNPRTMERLDGKREELMLVLGEICVWAFSPDNVELMQSLLTACYPLLLENMKPGGSGGCDDDGSQLRTAFLDCVTRCWSALDIFLQSPRATQTKIRSVRELSDAVLGVVYSDPALEELRSGLRDMLQRPTIVLEDSKENCSAGSGAYGSVTPRCNLVGWRGFVAQVREGYLRDQYSGRGLPWSPRLGISARPNRWAADWLLQPSSLSAIPHTDSPRRTTRESHGSSMWTSCLALSQLLHLKIAAVGDPLHTLYVQAVPSVLFQDNAWLRLICDGRVRVAPVAPNGLTSLMGSAFCGFGGDYVAYRLEPQSSNDVAVSGKPAADNYLICLEFYWWPLGKTQHGEVQNRLVAFRSVVTLKAATSGALMEAQMELERGFVEYEAAEMPELELWAPTERVQAVASWQPWLSIEGVYARK
ncbi:hypothetical protein KRP22_006939 [Phytophthora ramorum]|nr:hypothetical protein KRP22_15331 [Phytophthora ramorum]